MLRDTRVKNDVRAAPQSDPHIKDPDLIAVSVDGIGTVVLRGAVANPPARMAAVRDARSVNGVFNVIADDLKIHPPVEHRRADDKLRAKAIQQLIEDPWARFDHVHVKVSHGQVKLTGYVRQEPASAAAAHAVASISGVTGVTNEIEVV